MENYVYENDFPALPCPQNSENFKVLLNKYACSKLKEIIKPSTGESGVVPLEVNKIQGQGNTTANSDSKSATEPKKEESHPTETKIKELTFESTFIATVETLPTLTTQENPPTDTHSHISTPTKSETTDTSKHFLHLHVFGKSFTLVSTKSSVSIKKIKQFIEKITGIKQHYQFIQTKTGLSFHPKAVINLFEINKLQLYQPGFGGGQDEEHQGACGPCIICKKEKHRYIHLFSKLDQPKFIDFVKRKHSNIKEDSCICPTCLLRFNRQYAVHDHTQNNEDQENIKKKKLEHPCIFMSHNLCSKDCTSTRPSPLSFCDFNLCFSSDFANLDTSKPMYLCEIHYLEAFNFKYSKKKCKLCGIQLRSSRKFLANFNEIKLQQFVEDQGLKGISLLPKDMLCKKCHSNVYKFCVKEPVKNSTDITPKQYVLDVLKSVNNNSEKFNIDKNIENDYPTRKLLEYVCNELINEQALYLTELVHRFKEYGGSFSSSFNQKRVISDYLQEIFKEAVCLYSYDRYGTMVTLKGSDYAKCLLQLLHNNYQLKSLKSEPASESIYTNINNNSILKQGCEQLKYLLKDFEKNLSFEFKDLDDLQLLEAVKKYCPPDLWEFLKCLTSAKTFQSVPDIDVDNNDSSFKVMNILFSLLFRLNSKCNTFQLLIADIIDKFTSSSDCINILNKFGICVSKQTLERNQTMIVENKLNNPVDKTPSTLVIASVDNINKRSSYSAVKATDSHRGFDGTSVQVVEPKPNTIKLNPDEKLDIIQGELYTTNNLDYTCIKHGSEQKLLSFFLSAAIAMNFSFINLNRNSGGKCNEEDEIKQRSLTDNIIDQCFTAVLNDIQLLDDSKFCQLTDFNPDEHINHELYMYNLSRDVTYMDMCSLAYLTGSRVTIFEHKDKCLSSIAQFSPHSNMNHSFNFLCKNGYYFPLISRQEYFSGNLFQEHINLCEISTLRKFNSFNHKLSSISDVYSSLNKNLAEVKYRRRSSNLPVYEIKSNKICTNLVDEIIKDKVQQLTTPPTKSSFNMSDFECSNKEKEAADAAGITLFQYCFQKISDSQAINKKDLQTFICENQNIPSTEKAKVKFHSLLDEPADSKDTLKIVLDKLHSDFKIGQELKHLLVVGDGKTYDLLVKLKCELNEDLDWLLPFPGDWHILKNFQRMIMKLYLDAGIKELIDLFHNGAVGTSVMQATNFDKTHNFLMQVWEALYLHQLKTIIKYADSNQLQPPEQSFLRKASNIMKNAEINSEQRLQHLIDLMYKFHVEFRELSTKFCQQNESWKFWNTFVHYHGFIYVSYFISIRSGDWYLRNYCIKHIAKISQITDSKFYSRLLPYHIANLKVFPKSIIDHFIDGGWVVNILGRGMHSQGLDEAHESCINREMKSAMTNIFTESSLNKLVNYIPFRAKVLSNIKQQLDFKQSTIFKQYDRPDYEINNISMYLQKIQSGYFFRCEINKLQHAFNIKINLSGAQKEDLLNFEKISQEHLQKYIKSCQSDGIFRYNKTRKIKTFSTKAHTVSKVKRELKDQRTENSLLRKQIAWSKEQNTPISDLQQFISLPRAIVDHDGLPYKGDKSKTLSIFHSRYPEAFKTKLDCTSDCIIIDGMFILNTKPLKSSNRFFAHYIVSLFNKWIIPHIMNNTAEIHIVFDNQTPDLSPKDVERKRRDQNSESSNPINVSETSPVPSDWQKFLRNRENKKQLVKLVCEKFVYFSKIALQPSQKCFIAGGFEDPSITKKVSYKSEEVLADLQSNISEGDSRVWLHAVYTTCKNIMIYSLDNDTYHIGLPILEKCKGKNISVQLSYKNELIFFSLNRFLTCLQRDPDLQNIEKEDLPSILQSLYILTGCDYISFFRDHGKVSFYNTFFKYPDFINNKLSGDHLPCNGNLSQTQLNNQNGFLSFLRLLGCEYWRKCSSAFLREHLETPEQLYNSVNNPILTPEKNHAAWLSKIREALYCRVPSEEFYLPSTDALHLHWKRACWVSHIWAQASQKNVQYPQLSQFGWNIVNDQLKIIWDVDENLERISNNIKLWTAGCNCIKLECNNKICGCKKSNRICGPGCKCGISCKNKKIENHENSISSENKADIPVTNSDSESDSSNADSDENEETVFYPVAFQIDDVEDNDLENVILDLKLHHLQ